MRVPPGSDGSIRVVPEACSASGITLSILDSGFSCAEFPNHLVAQGEHLGKEVGQLPSRLGSAPFCTRLLQWTSQSCCMRSSHALRGLRQLGGRRQ